MNFNVEKEVSAGSLEFSVEESADFVVWSPVDSVFFLYFFPTGILFFLDTIKTLETHHHVASDNLHLSPGK